MSRPAHGDWVGRATKRTYTPSSSWPLSSSLLFSDQTQLYAEGTETNGVVHAGQPPTTQSRASKGRKGTWKDTEDTKCKHLPAALPARARGWENPTNCEPTMGIPGQNTLDSYLVVLTPLSWSPPLPKSFQLSKDLTALTGIIYLQLDLDDPLKRLHLDNELNAASSLCASRGHGSATA